MNSWEIIKKETRREHTRDGSIGELVDVNNASKIYMALRHKLKDIEAADRSFNDDELVTKGLRNRSFLAGAGL